jgi:hypothetical protein
MKTQLDTNEYLESSEIAQEKIENGKVFPIPISGILWVIVIILGVFLSLMLLFVSLALWIVTKNPIFITSSVCGGILFVIWGYINLKDNGDTKKPEKRDLIRD